MLVTAVIFITGNLKDFLRKVLILLNTPSLGYYGTKTRVEFNGNCLKQDSVTFNHKKVVNIYIVYEIDNRKKDILILGKVPTQGLEHTLSAEKMYLTDFTEHNKKFCLTSHYNGEKNGYLFVNGKEIHKFKENDSEIVATPLCLGNISRLDSR